MTEEEWEELESPVKQNVDHHVWVSTRTLRHALDDIRALQRYAEDCQMVSFEAGYKCGSLQTKLDMAERTLEWIATEAISTGACRQVASDALRSIRAVDQQAESGDLNPPQ